MAALTDDDIRAIEQIHDGWIAAERQGRPLDVLVLCAEDVQWLVPGAGMLQGKEAARSLLTEAPATILGLETSAPEIRGQGGFAYKTSRYVTRFVVEGNTAEQQARGTHLWILRKDQEASWRVVLVTWQAHG